MLQKVVIKYVRMIRNTSSFDEWKFSNCNLSAPVIHVSYIFSKLSVNKIFYVYMNSFQIQQSYFFLMSWRCHREMLCNLEEEKEDMDSNENLPRNEISKPMKIVESNFVGWNVCPISLTDVALRSHSCISIRTDGSAGASSLNPV